jgi:uncharacterized protein
MAAMTDDDPPVPSPCVRLCTLDDADVCLGCFRSLDEIRDWTQLDSAARRAVLDNAERRRAASPTPSWWRRGVTRRG